MTKKSLKVIAFDADDTLWRNEELFWEFKDEFKTLLSKYALGMDSEELEAYLYVMEVGNIPNYGYGFKSYTLSMIEAAIELTDGKVSAKDIARLLQLLKRQMHAELDFFPHVRETLQALRGQVDLMLITKGDTAEQRHKIDKSGLMPFFRWVEIVHRKDEETYRELLEKYSIEPEAFLMVGNSLRSDVLPVVALGGQGVYIHNGTTWAHELEIPSDWEDLAYLELEHMGDLPRLLEQMGYQLGAG
ncbi:MAG: HAD family hydrolase [Anaerolineaceae bacterium]|nr:HAD family hydrolase [Anaerolineaceae bacterium]